jgi:hypothetical protein
MEPLVRRWAAEQPQTPLWQALLLLLLASSGRTAEASELLARLAADGVLGYGDNGPFPLTPDQVTPVALAEAIALLGDAGAADGLYRRLAPFGGRVVVTNTGLLFGGAVDHWLGRLAVTAGSQAEASGIWRRRWWPTRAWAPARCSPAPACTWPSCSRTVGQPATRSGRWRCWRAAWPTPGRSA